MQTIKEFLEEKKLNLDENIEELRRIILKTDRPQYSLSARTACYSDLGRTEDNKFDFTGTNWGTILQNYITKELMQCRIEFDKTIKDYLERRYGKELVADLDKIKKIIAISNYHFVEEHSELGISYKFYDGDKLEFSWTPKCKPQIRYNVCITR